MGPACVKCRIGKKSVGSFSLLSSRDGSCLHCSFSNRRNRDGDSKSSGTFDFHYSLGQQLPPALQKWSGKLLAIRYAQGSVGRLRRNVELPASVAGSGTGIGFLRKECGLSTTSPQTHLPSSAPEGLLMPSLVTPKAGKACARTQLEQPGALPLCE